MTPLSFSVANFKSFGSRPNEIPLRPITLVFGPNSAGKSSLLQALMYLEDILENGELDVIAPRAGRGKVDLGGFKQILHRRSGLQHLVLGLTYPPDIIPMPDRNWWPMERGFSINLTLGPLSHGGDLGTKGVSLEIDGQELLRASRVEEGPMKIDLFDFAHPVMSNLLATLGAGRMSDSDDDELGVDWDELHLEDIVEYFNFTVLRGAFELTTDDLLPRALNSKFIPDVTETPDKDSHIRMTLFVEAWQSHIELFLQDTLPGAFKSLFSAFKGYSRSSLSSIRHVPPLRDLPPRVFDLNQHPDPLWRRIANQPELRARINGWLGAGFMKTRYELQVREYAPIDEITSRVPEALDSQMMRVFQKPGFGSGIDEILGGLYSAYEAANKRDYVHAHPDLLEELVRNQLAHDEQWARDDQNNTSPDRDYLLLSPKQKLEEAKNGIESILTDEPDLFDEIWEHYQTNSPELRGFLSESWDPHETAKEFNHSIIPDSLERRKEIALTELPANIKVSLQDVGVGISQVLPVLMNAFGEQGSLIAIEQPEIHIHPALQAELGDVFIESAIGASKNTFLLETHSEHLILRILRRVRESSAGDFSEWPNALRLACPNGIRPSDVAVLYVQPGDEGAEVIELPLTPDGDFTCPWPSGFFTERAKELY